MTGDFFYKEDEEEEDKEESTEDSNIEWSKYEPDNKERLTLKIDIQEANLYQAKKDKKKKSKADASKDTLVGFKKVSKKIRGSLDEEDENEDDYVLVPVFLEQEDSSLTMSLTPQEKTMLDQQFNISIASTHEMAQKLQTIEDADKIFTKISGGKISDKVISKKMQSKLDASVEEIVLDELKDVAKKKGQKVKAKELGRKSPAKIFESKEFSISKVVKKAEQKEQQEQKEVVKKQKEQEFVQQDADKELASQNIKEKMNLSAEQTKRALDSVFETSSNEPIYEPKEEPAKEPTPEEKPIDKEALKEILYAKSGRAPTPEMIEEQANKQEAVEKLRGKYYINNKDR